MNIVDIVLVLIIIVAITIGYCRGFLASIIKIAALVTSILAAKFLHGEAVGIIKGISMIKNFVESTVNVIVEKFGLQAIAELPGRTLENVESLSQGNAKYLQSTVDTLQKLIGDNWMEQSENIKVAIGEMLYSTIAYIILLLGVFLVILIVGNIIIKIIHSSTILKGTDMILGAVFTGGIATILMFVIVKIITPLLLGVSNEGFVSSIEGSKIIGFIMNFFA